MNILTTDIKDLLVVEPRIFEDARGYFFESYNKKEWERGGLDYTFLQDNVSWSRKGVLRGLHLQVGEFAQAKLVSVLHGRVLDVAVDLRVGSATFGKSASIELSAENRKQFLIPRGFAHGFVVLSDSAVFSYKCDNVYEPKAERGIIYNDPDLSIDWGLEESQLIVSPKDLKNVFMKDLINELAN